MLLTLQTLLSYLSDNRLIHSSLVIQFINYFHHLNTNSYNLFDQVQLAGIFPRDVFSRFITF
jgi:hypothetical protein